MAVFFQACHQGESMSGHFPDEKGMLNVHVLDEGGSSVISGSSLAVDPPEFAWIQGRSPKIQSATGTFTVLSGNQYDFAAIQNPGGIHGEITIESMTRGTITAEALCVSTVDGEATAGILLTSVEFPTPFFDAGDIVYLKLRDNGEGANTASDQVSSNIIIFYFWELLQYETPEDFVSDFSCAHIELIYSAFSGLTEPFGPYEDILDGNVQVK